MDESDVHEYEMLSNIGADGSFPSNVNKQTSDYIEYYPAAWSSLV